MTAVAGASLGANLTQLLFPELEQELTSTRRVLDRAPGDRGDWRPHEKSRTLSELASHVAGIPRIGVAILTTNELDLAGRTPQPPATSTSELLDRYDKGVAELRAAVAAATPESWAREWTFRAGPKVIRRGPKSAIFRLMMVNHIVHHRAQLGVYLRLLGVPVPGVYGPSADEPM